MTELEIAELSEEVELDAVRTKQLEEFRLKDHKAENYLFQATDRLILEITLSKKTSKHI